MKTSPDLIVHNGNIATLNPEYSEATKLAAPRPVNGYGWLAVGVNSSSRSAGCRHWRKLTRLRLIHQCSSCICIAVPCLTKPPCELAVIPGTHRTRPAEKSSVTATGIRRDSLSRV